MIAELRVWAKFIPHLIRIDSAERKIFRRYAAFGKCVVQGTLPDVRETHNTNLQPLNTNEYLYTNRK